MTPPQVDKDGNIVKQATYRTLPESDPHRRDGRHAINFMGDPSSSNPEEHQTYPVRSYSGYAETPRRRIPRGGPHEESWGTPSSW